VRGSGGRRPEQGLLLSKTIFQSSSADVVPSRDFNTSSQSLLAQERERAGTSLYSNLFPAGLHKSFHLPRLFHLHIDLASVR
jgi:hypothetical protein